MRAVSQIIGVTVLGGALAGACGDDPGDPEARCADLTEKAAAFLESHAPCTEHSDCQQLPTEHYADNIYCRVAANTGADTEEWADLAESISRVCPMPDECYVEDLGELAYCIDSVCQITSPGACVGSSTPLSGLDEVGVVGVSAADVLAQAEGQYAGELSWVENVVSHPNKNTTTPVDITVAYEGGEIRDVHVASVPCVGGWGCHPCPEGALEVDVSMRVTSEDGGADELLPVTIVQEAGLPDEGIDMPPPRVYQAYDPDDVEGGIESTDLELPPDGSFNQLVLTAEFADDICSGEISAEAEVAGGVGFGPIASWEATRI